MQLPKRQLRDNFEGNTLTRVKRLKYTYLMTSLVPGLGNRQLNFLPTLQAKKIILGAGPELKLKNYESVQHRLQFSGIKKGAKISFHRHFQLMISKFKHLINMYM